MKKLIMVLGILGFSSVSFANVQAVHEVYTAQVSGTIYNTPLNPVNISGTTYISNTPANSVPISGTVFQGTIPWGCTITGGYSYIRPDGVLAFTITTNGADLPVTAKQNGDWNVDVGNQVWVLGSRQGTESGVPNTATMFVIGGTEFGTGSTNGRARRVGIADWGNMVMDELRSGTDLSGVLGPLLTGSIPILKTNGDQSVTGAKFGIASATPFDGTEHVGTESGTAAHVKVIGTVLTQTNAIGSTVYPGPLSVWTITTNGADLPVTAKQNGTWIVGLSAIGATVYGEIDAFTRGDINNAGLMTLITATTFTDDGNGAAGKALHVKDVATIDGVTIRITPPIFTTEYTDGDCLSTSFLIPYPEDGILQNVRIFDADGEEAPIDLVLFDGVYVNDAGKGNSEPFDPADASMRTYSMGVINIGTGNYGSYADNSEAVRAGLGYAVAPSSTVIIGQLVIRQDTTYSAVNDITVALDFLRK